MTEGPELLRAVGVSHETCERLETHRALLADWNARMNLVGPNELHNYWSRHALDCAQLLALAPEGAKTVLDLGSGAGFPGLVTAAQLADVSGARVDLVEKSPKKSAFLRAAAEAMGVPARVPPLNAADLPDADYDVILARAFAPLPRLMDHARRFLTRGAIGLFPKGSGFASELTAAGFTPNGGAFSSGSMRAELLVSQTNPEARVIRIWSPAGPG